MKTKIQSKIWKEGLTVLPRSFAADFKINTLFY